MRRWWLRTAAGATVHHGLPATATARTEVHQGLQMRQRARAACRHRHHHAAAQASARGVIGSLGMKIRYCDSSHHKASLRSVNAFEVMPRVLAVGRGQVLHRHLPHGLVWLDDRPELPPRHRGLRKPVLMAPLDVLGTEDGIHPIVGQPLRRLMLGEYFGAGEQEIAEGLAADELMDPVMDDALLRVIPERSERGYRGSSPQACCPLLDHVCLTEATACLAKAGGVGGSGHKRWCYRTDGVEL